MTEKDVAEVMEEETIETYEFTDDDGQDHCFVVESKFKVGKDDYVALLEVDPAIFSEEDEECGCGHDHEEEDEDEEPNIILAKIVTDANGDVDIQVPTDEEFEKARIAYEALDA